MPSSDDARDEWFQTAIGTLMKRELNGHTRYSLIASVASARGTVYKISTSLQSNFTVVEFHAGTQVKYAMQVLWDLQLALGGTYYTKFNGVDITVGEA